MKKIIPLLIMPLSFATFASNTIKLGDSNSLPSCDNGSQYISDPNAGYECIDVLASNYMSRTSQNNLLPNFIAFNNQDTVFMFQNKGGYVARFQVEFDKYDENTGERTRHNYTSHNLGLHSGVAVELGKNITYAKASAELRNANGSWKTIFSELLNPVDIKYRVLNSKNGVQWDVWGTIFNSPYKKVQPANTYNFLETDYVMLYANKDWDTDDTVLAAAIDTDIPDLGIRKYDGIANHGIKSWSIPKGWKVRFFEQTNYQGAYYTRDGNGKASEAALIDKIKSIQILARP